MFLAAIPTLKETLPVAYQAELLTLTRLRNQIRLMPPEDQSNHHQVFRSRLSFLPLLNQWNKLIQAQSDGKGKIYRDLSDLVSPHPELLQPIDNFYLLKSHRSVIDQMMTTVFPVAVKNEEQLYAVSVPFSNKIVYASSLFSQMFLDEKSNICNLDSSEKSSVGIKVCIAYAVILERFYGIKLKGKINSVYSYNDKKKKHTNFYEIHFDPQFIEVHTTFKLPEIPEDFFKTLHYLKDINNQPELSDLLPLEQFEFEGMTILHIDDVTEQELLRNVQNSLLAPDVFTEKSNFNRLCQELSQLLHTQESNIGFLSFLQSNIASGNSNNTTSLVLKSIRHDEERSGFYSQLKEAFIKNNSQPLLITGTPDEKAKQFPFTKNPDIARFRMLSFFPLKDGKEITGALEIFSVDENFYSSSFYSGIDSVCNHLQLALKKSTEQANNEINKIIKEQFTAVQSSVEWRFVQAATNFLARRNKGEEVKMEPIVFEQVFPLYGAIDIRNSSGERNNAIQQDLVQQLRSVREIVTIAESYMTYPLLREIISRIDVYMESVTNFLFTDDEQKVHFFLREEAEELLLHLKETIPDLAKRIDEYFSSIDPRLHVFNKNRTEFEESVTRINNQLSGFLDREQGDAQAIYPHYFERFVTDGVDFNIYIGQSIAPAKKFGRIYLKNLKLWQLATLARAAQRTHRLENLLSVRLQTTQLILVHSEPISISFRNAERKFDVDGVYNVRYEVLKKRIDKVHIKFTNERLTQPGTIAIAYSNKKEANEYLQFLEYLKKQQLVTGDVEKFDLEELQGISGLKALRVKVLTDDFQSEEVKDKISQKKNI